MSEAGPAPDADLEDYEQEISQDDSAHEERQEIGDDGHGDGGGNGGATGRSSGRRDLCSRWKAEVLSAGKGAGDSTARGAAAAAAAALRGGAFRDAWLALHGEPAPRSSDPWEVRHALTFPSCNVAHW